MKRLPITFAFLAVLSMLLLAGNAFCEEYKTAPTIVTLTGRLEMRQFTDESYGKTVRAPVLVLDSPIDVAADDLGKTKKGVNILQVAAMPAVDYKELKNLYLDKKVVMTGGLYHAISAHQYTDVLITLYKMEDVRVAE